ncbi:hypothetical protein ANN_18326 [Periplaneta americana]|uniref:Medium-chain acyl-CoA ligase ACSF2, mitochondrial n=1 Tax=Periplaneta americana TaxID=6978 RepID=A0ABQ8SPP6_PERAM|nr:hypothetical protein ANN_18326 [Periplaneta americana]
MQKRSYCHNPGSFPLVPYTLGDLLDIAADCWGDNEAIISVYEKQHLTYKECSHCLRNPMILYPETHLAILRHLHDAVRRKWPNLWQGQNWVLHHDNTPAHRSLLVSEFLAQYKRLVLRQPPYSPDLAPADFYLFPKVKSLFKGQRFASAEEVKIHATLALREVTKDGCRNVSRNDMDAGRSVSLLRGRTLKAVLCKWLHVICNKALYACSVTKLAAGLLHLGLKPGDRVGIWSYNCVQWYITYMAIAKAGLITVTLNPESEPPELLYCLKKVQVKALVCAERRDSESCYDLVSKIIPELSSCQSSDVEFHSAEIPSLTSLIIMSDQKFPGAYRLQDIVAFATPESLKRSEEVQKMVQPDEGCLIIFSSKHRFCLSTQFCHISASCCSVIPALHIGGAVVIPGYKYDPIELLNAVKAEKCTAMLSLPSLYTKMVNAVKEDPELASDSFEVCVLGGANASPSQLHDVLKYIRAARVVRYISALLPGKAKKGKLSAESVTKRSCSPQIGSTFLASHDDWCRACGSIASPLVFHPNSPGSIPSHVMMEFMVDKADVVQSFLQVTPVSFYHSTNTLPPSQDSQLGTLSALNPTDLLGSDAQCRYTSKSHSF